MKDKDISEGLCSVFSHKIYDPFVSVCSLP